MQHYSPAYFIACWMPKFPGPSKITPASLQLILDDPSAWRIQMLGSSMAKKLFEILRAQLTILSYRNDLYFLGFGKMVKTNVHSFDKKWDRDVIFYVSHCNLLIVVGLHLSKMTFNLSRLNFIPLSYHQPKEFSSLDSAFFKVKVESHVVLSKLFEDC